MSGNKTEKPTKKKLRDAAKKGQTFKSRDLIVTILMLVGILYLVYFLSIDDLLVLIATTTTHTNTEINIHSFINELFVIFIKILAPIIGVCIIATVLPSLFQAGFVLALKALKLNFNAFNPINGLKKLFSLRNVKDLIKAILYLGCFVIALWHIWDKNKSVLFSQLYTSPEKILAIWGSLLYSLFLTIITCIIFVLVLDMLSEFFLYLRDQKMDKQEVKREYKEQESSPEVKSRRREMHHEILSEQNKSDIKQSKVIIANPTHIAIGIYFNPDIFPAPVISLIETNQRAILTRRYAEKVGVTVVEDITLARKLFKTHSKYTVVKLEELDEVLRLLTWLQQVENSWKNDLPNDNNPM